MIITRERFQISLLHLHNIAQQLATIIQSHFKKLSKSGLKQNSGLLNSRDKLLMILMACSEALVDSRGFDILKSPPPSHLMSGIFIIDTKYRNINH
jgi:hypothetical protein